ncbi:MAG: response regulator [Bacteroidota bacterium]
MEDDIVDQMAILRMVKQHRSSFQLKTADSLAAATNILKEADVDLIISDYNLGDGSAMELLEKYQDIPIILITGLNDSDSIRRFKKAGAAEVLVKDNQLEYIRNLPALIEQTFHLPESGKVGSHDSGHSDASRQSRSASRIINLSFLSNTFDGNKSLIGEMVQTFLDQNPVDLQKLTESLERENLDTAQLMAHKIKSGYKLMGMRTQEELAEKIELQSADPSVEIGDLRLLATQLVEGTQQAYGLLIEQLRAFQ